MLEVTRPQQQGYVAPQADTPQRTRIALLFLRGRLNRIVANHDGTLEVLMADEPKNGLMDPDSIVRTEAQVDPELIAEIWRRAGEK